MIQKVQRKYHSSHPSHVVLMMNSDCLNWIWRACPCLSICNSPLILFPRQNEYRAAMVAPIVPQNRRHSTGYYMRYLRIVVQGGYPFNMLEHNNTKARSLPYVKGYRLALLLIILLYNPDTHLFTPIDPDELRTARQYLDHPLLISFSI